MIRQTIGELLNTHVTLGGSGILLTLTFGTLESTYASSQDCSLAAGVFEAETQPQLDRQRVPR